VENCVLTILDLQHHLFTLTFDGKLHIAPIEEIKGGIHNVLDIGTGTGIWAMDFGMKFFHFKIEKSLTVKCGSRELPICQRSWHRSKPHTISIVGATLFLTSSYSLILSSSYPLLLTRLTSPTSVPPNCSFEVDDAEDPWVFPQKFDYIHGRALMSCFKNHKTVWENAFKALRPGGILELQDVQMPLQYVDSSGEGTAVKLWNERFMAGALALGRDFKKVAKYKAVLQEVGFVNVVEKLYVWPMGTWARGKTMKTLGAWFREDSLSGLHGGSSVILTRGCGMSPEEVEVFLVDVRNEMKSNKIHAYVQV
jgi:hypothetical protein